MENSLTLTRDDLNDNFKMTRVEDIELNMFKITSDDIRRHRFIIFMNGNTWKIMKNATGSNGVIIKIPH